MFAGCNGIVTGGGQGIGRAIARMLAGQGMRLAVVDLQPDAARAVADETGGIALTCDLRQPDQIAETIAKAQARLGDIDMLVSNAGFARGALDGPCSVPDALWQDSWDLHVMAHLRAARLLLPGMQARRRGWLVNVASAAGLLSQIGDAPYSATKHAAVSLAQSLAIEHGDEGIQVSVLCPLYVATPLLGYAEDAAEPRPERVLRAQDVANALLDGLREERFLILPHPEAGTFFQRRAEDTDRWIEGMRRLRRKVYAGGQPADLADLHRRI